MAENTNLCNDEWEVSRSHEILALSLACCSDHDLKRKKKQQTTGKIKNVGKRFKKESWIMAVLQTEVY